MTIHLIKLAVGIEDVRHLAQIQKERLKSATGPQKGKSKGTRKTLRHITRHKPRRETEILDGGSLYWVIGGAIVARQRILGFEDAAKRDGTPACAIVLDPVLVPTLPRGFRPFQGWRYLAPEKAPPDSKGGAGGEVERLPPHLRKELADLGLL
ncbi:MAG: DUF1489 family protein [Alphaproteobacteria bacterium]|nr:DUF1489 family protein [Alphaproteobacteria bacterium]